MDAFTPEQRAFLVDLFRSVNMLLAHASDVSATTAGALAALRKVLTARGIVTNEEWDAAVEEFQDDEHTLSTLDPDVQAAPERIRRVYPWFMTEEGDAESPR